MPVQRRCRLAAPSLLPCPYTLGMAGPSLRRRNALWLALRTAEPGSGPFEEALQELSQLTGWARPRILAGLGLSREGTEETVHPSAEEPT